MISASMGNKLTVGKVSVWIDGSGRPRYAGRDCTPEQAENHVRMTRDELDRWLEACDDERDKLRDLEVQRQTEAETDTALEAMLRTFPTLDREQARQLVRAALNSQRDRRQALDPILGGNREHNAS